WREISWPIALIQWAMADLWSMTPVPVGGLNRVELGAFVVVKGNGCNRENTAFGPGEPAESVDASGSLGTSQRAGVAPPQNLMRPLSCKPIAPVPKLANRTPLALVINSFLVRTANYAIGHRDRSHLMLVDKFKYLAGNACIGADVTTIH